jgi:hypothetical protein
LTPTDIYVELGKLCFYTHKGEFTVPREYFFVSPRDVGTSLWKLFEKPDDLKQALIANWDKYCRDEISDVPVTLTGELAAYVEAFDFGIVSYYPVRKVIEEHKATPHHVLRFGGGLPDRPLPEVPPPVVADGDCLSCQYKEVDSLPEGVHRRHFDRSREDFYRAESLAVFSRASVPPGTFESLQKNVYKGVVDVAESAHDNGFTDGDQSSLGAAD